MVCGLGMGSNVVKSRIQAIGTGRGEEEHDGCRPGVFQRDDGEDGPPVHASHAGAVAHVVVVDGGAVGADLGEGTGPR